MFYLFTLFSVSLLCGYARSQECDQTTVADIDLNEFFGVKPWYVVASTPNRPIPFPNCPTAMFEKDDNGKVTYTYAWADNKQVWIGDMNDEKKIDLTLIGPVILPRPFKYKGVYTVMEKEKITEADGETDYALVHFCTSLLFDFQTLNNYMILTSKIPVSDSTWNILNERREEIIQREMEICVDAEEKLEQN